MRDKLIELKVKVTELEDLLHFITSYNVPLSEAGYAYLVAEVKRIKTDLAELEAELRLESRRKILMN